MAPRSTPLAAVLAALAVQLAAAQTITITAFPPAGGLTTIAGTVGGLGGPPTGFKAVLYVLDGSGDPSSWWIKPLPGSSVTLSAAGVFSFPDWASNPPTDVLIPTFAIVIIPVATPVITVLGGPLPVYPSAVATAILPAGYVPGTTATPSPVGPPPAAAIVITAFPPAGGLTSIAGTVTGLAVPTAFKAVLYVLDGSGDPTSWWIKPIAGASVTLSPTGAFAFPDWASNPPTDVGVLSFAIFIIPVGTPVITVLGDPLPTYPSAVASATYPRGFTPPGTTATPTPTSSPPPGVTATPTPTRSPGSVAIVITAFPPAGGLTPISGFVTGLAVPTGFKAVLYVLDGSGDPTSWWIKPLAGSSVPLSATGAFSFPDWASNPPTDVLVLSFAIFIIPVATPVITVSGAPLPSYPTAVTSGIFPRGFTPPGTTPTPTPTPSPSAGAVAIVITAFPPAGGLTTIAGFVTGLAVPTGFKAVLYVLDGSGDPDSWWIKPIIGSSVPLSATGAFAFPDWASFPPTDVLVRAFAIYIIPAATPVITVLSAPLPLYPTAVALGTYPRGFVPPP